MFVHVIAVFILLSVITAGEGSCEPPRRGQHLYYNVTSDPDFRLWLKMEEKNTNLKTSLLLDSGTAPVPKFQMFVWSNTDVYKGFSNKLIMTEFGITGKNISHVTIGANASMEWIYCTNSFTFPAPNNPNASSVPASDNKVMTVVVVVVVVLVMVLLVVVVMLAAAGAYIHRLGKTHNKSTKPVVNKEQVAVLVVLVLLLVGELVVVVITLV
nr:uncharacterized protein LOC123757494 isoform X3 [Procambarus clarkii]